MFKLFKKIKEREEVGADAMAEREEPKNNGAAGEGNAKESEEEGDSLSQPEDETEDQPAAEETGKEAGETLGECFAKWLGENVEETKHSEAMEAMRIIETALSGEYEMEAMFELVVKGADYERAVEEAELAGEIRGRNTRIEEEKELIYDSDGLPHPGTSGNAYQTTVPGIFQVAREARY